MGTKDMKKKKRLPRLLSCFGGRPSVSGETSATHQLKDQRQRLQPSSTTSSTWSRFRAKKKTVPIDAAVDGDGDLVEMAPIAIANDDEETSNHNGVSGKKTKKKKIHLPPWPKGLFKKPQKNKGPPKSQPPTKDGSPTRSGPYESPQHSVISRADDIQSSRAQQAGSGPTSDTAQARPRISSSADLPSSPPTISRAQYNQGKDSNNKEGKKKKKKGRRTYGIEPGLVVIVVALAAMLCGGRMFAILFMSALFYALPYLRSACGCETSCERKKSYWSTDDMRSGPERRRRVNNVAVRGSVERNGRSSK